MIGAAGVDSLQLLTPNSSFLTQERLCLYDSHIHERRGQ